VIAAAESPSGARNRMMLQHLGLARSIAKTFEGRGLPLDDLTQAAVLGLAHAVEKFDPSRGFAFSTFAVRLIRQAVRRALRDDAAIRLPEGLIAMLARLARAEAALAQELGRQPTFEEIVERLDLTPRQARLAMLGRAARAVARGDADDERDAVSAAPAPGPEADATAARIDPIERLADLCEALLRLSPGERRVMHLRLGLGEAGGGRRHTLAEVGERLGFTRQRAQQIEAAALGKVRPLCR